MASASAAAHLAAGLAKGYVSGRLPLEGLAEHLPSLLYASCSVWQPAARSFVAATSSDATMALAAYDLGGCVAGLALARGALLQASLHPGSPAQRFLEPLPDVQQLLAYEPGCSHVLCVPFGNGPTGHWDRYACGHRRAKGALLLGLRGAPKLTPASLALLSALGDALSTSLAKQARDVAAFAEYVCGCWETRCTCSEDGASDNSGSDGDSGSGEEDEAEEDGAGRAAPCREDDPGGSNDSASGGWANVVPTTKQADVTHHPSEEQQQRGSPAKAPYAAARSVPQHSMHITPASVHHAAKLAALPDSAGLASDPLWLGFADPGVEGQYRLWYRQQRTVVEVFACLFTLLSAVVAGWGEPYCLAVRAPGGLAIAAGLCLLMAFSASPPGHRALPSGTQDALAAVLQLVATALFKVAGQAVFAAGAVALDWNSWLAVWMACGAHSLLVTAVGFQARIQLQAALQSVKLAIAATNMPALCIACFPGALASTCSALGVCGLAAAGFAGPLALAFVLERGDRRTFAGQVQRELEQY